MRLVLPQTTLLKLRDELQRAGRREIGGLLFGEHIGHDSFRVVDISVQRSGGSAAHFVRDPAANQAQLDEFFARTGADYMRFNYLGEWHSHPSFAPSPSLTDLETMQSIVEDPAVGVNFLVLLIARMMWWGRIGVSGALIVPGGDPATVDIRVEGDVEMERLSVRLIRRFIGRSV